MNGGFIYKFHNTTALGPLPSLLSESQIKKPRQHDRAFASSARKWQLGANDTHVTTIARALDFKLHGAVSFGKQRMVFAHADISARMKLRTALTNDDAASVNRLTTKHLDAKTFTFRVPTVAGTTTCFLVSHG